MDNEMVDVITPDNQVVSQISKVEAHRQGLLHRCVVAELIDSQGNWTLVRQADDRQDAGQYVSPVGGHISAGESEESALIRETFEEIGITPTRFERVGQGIFNRKTLGRTENHMLVVYKVFSDDDLTLNHESVGYEKFSPEQLRKELTENPTKFGDAFHFVFEMFYHKSDLN